MLNMNIYDKVRSVPEEAQKKITGGRLNGMTDINPMWRIKVLTETFGPVGIGWKCKIINKHLEHGANDEIAAFVDIELYYKYEDEWSEAIPGTGGSSFVSKERNGLYTSDECYKMAFTDALSVACKLLGVAADIYFEKDRTKYDITDFKSETKPSNQISQPPNTSPQQTGCSAIQSLTEPQKITKTQRMQLYKAANENVDFLKSILNTCGYNDTSEVNSCDFDNVMTAIKLKQAS